MCCSFLSFFYILNINLLSKEYFPNIFSYSFGCLCTLLSLCFLVLCKLIYLFLLLLPVLLGVSFKIFLVLKEYSHVLKHFPWFLLVVSSLTFKSLTQFRLILWLVRSNSIHTHVHTHMHMHTRTHTSTYTHMHTHHTHTHLQIPIHTCTPAQCTQVCMHICTCNTYKQRSSVSSSLVWAEMPNKERNDRLVNEWCKNNWEEKTSKRRN